MVCSIDGRSSTLLLGGWRWESHTMDVHSWRTTASGGTRFTQRSESHTVERRHSSHSARFDRLNPDDISSSLACCLGPAVALDFHRHRKNIFLVGTEDGKIYKASVNDPGMIDMAFDAHDFAVYSIQWRFDSTLFIHLIHCSSVLFIRIYSLPAQPTAPLKCGTKNSRSYSPRSTSIHLCSSSQAMLDAIRPLHESTRHCLVSVHVDDVRRRWSRRQSLRVRYPSEQTRTDLRATPRQRHRSKMHQNRISSASSYSTGRR